MRARSQIANQRRIALRHSEKLRRGPQSRRFHCSRNIEHSEAFGHNYRMKVDVSASQALMNVFGAGRFVEKVFAGFERRPAMKVVPQKKRLFTADDTGSS